VAESRRLPSVVEADEVDQAALPGAERGQIRRYGRFDLVVVQLARSDRMQPRQVQRTQVGCGQLGPHADDRSQQAVTVLVEEVVVTVAVPNDRDDDVSAVGPCRR
jgi:hypothetical protein